LRVSTTDDDPYILSLYRVATDRVEKYCNRKLMQQTWYAYFDEWPMGNSFELPYAPLNALSSTSTGIVYYDQDNSSTLPDSSTYTQDTVSVPGRIVINNNADWPTDTLHNKNPIRVEFIAGYGKSSDVPEVFIQAANVWCSDMYENRESIVVGQSVSPIPMAVESLLYDERDWHF